MADTLYRLCLLCMPSIVVNLIIIIIIYSDLASKLYTEKEKTPAIAAHVFFLRTEM